MKRLVAFLTLVTLSIYLMAGCGSGMPTGDGSSTTGTSSTNDISSTTDTSSTTDIKSATDSGSATDTSSSSEASAYEPVAKDADMYYDRLIYCKEQIEKITDFKPEVVLVLGTGLGHYVDELDVETVIPYSDLEGWPNATVKEHKGNLVFANYKGIKLAVMQGRIHYYEGYDIADVVFPLRVLHLLGADTVIITNAVGAINREYKVGDFVCIRDHISSFVPSPLIGENLEELGERYTGMTDVYDKDLQKTILELGKTLGIPVHSGVFIQTAGPQFETPAEIKAYGLLGADTVGMSSAVEAIAAKHMDMRICMINSVTNMAAGIEENDFSMDSIMESFDKSEKNFTALINGLLDHLSQEKKEN